GFGTFGAEEVQEAPRPGPLADGEGPGAVASLRLAPVPFREEVDEEGVLLLPGGLIGRAEVRPPDLVADAVDELQEPFHPALGLVEMALHPCHAGETEDRGH